MEQTSKFDLLPYILVFTRKWRTLAGHFIFICIVAFVYVFFIRKIEYKSSITFLPPPGGSSSSLANLMGELSLPSMSSSEIIPEQIQTIFESSAIKRKIIEKFNLYNHYKLRKNRAKFILAQKRLSKDLILSSEEIGSIGLAKITSYSLDAFHTSSDTAFEMVNYAFSLMDSMVQTISADRAHKNRLFIEEQLNKNKVKLDSLQIVMQEFQSENKAYDIPEQIKMTIAAYAQLKATILANEVRMNSLKNDFSGSTPEIAELENQNKAYEQKLLQLETKESPDALPSFASSLKLAPKYANLIRDLEVQNQVILLLTKEFEQAKIKEVKYVSSLAIIDPAYIPEYKARPKRILEIGILCGIYMAFILFCYACTAIYSLHIKTNPAYKKILETLKE